MAGLQRSTISFRRQGSSGIVWDDRLIAELNQQGNDQKGETQQKDEQAKPVITSDVHDQTSKPIGGDGTDGGGGATRHHRNTGRVSPAVDPPSPRLSAFGCCSALGKKPPGKKVNQRKRPPKRRSSVNFQTDCKDLLRVIDSPEEWPSLASELEDFTSIKRLFSRFSLSFIPRDKNSRADCLAKKACARGSIFSHVSSTTPEWFSRKENLSFLS